MTVRANPYLIKGPAIISFSGGRTSAFMMWQIIQAHGGRLPDDLIVTFANTGKERPETLDFVARCASEWGVHVVWLEWRDDDVGFEIISHNSASRNGEPFNALILKKQMLPNSVMRFCTIELKIRVMKKYAQSLGWKHWRNIVGLRFDELHRVASAAARNGARNGARKEPFMTKCPMARAKHVKAHVSAFWRSQSFDLGLRDWEGNCDVCFLKGEGKRRRIAQDRPDLMGWWVDQEALEVTRGGRATPSALQIVPVMRSRWRGSRVTLAFLASMSTRRNLNSMMKPAALRGSVADA